MQPILDFPHYFVDKRGSIYSEKVKGSTQGSLRKIPIKIKPVVNKSGYSCVVLWKNRKRYFRKVHRLVLETFIGHCPPNQEACHYNCIRTDNRLNNLRWDTRANNILDSKRKRRPDVS